MGTPSHSAWPIPGNPLSLPPGLEFRSVLGHGAFGLVLEVWDQNLARALAVKILLDPRATDASTRLEREAKILAGIRHPNLVEVYDAGCLPEGPPFVAMEKLVGQDFEAVLETRGRLSWSEVRDILEGLLGGLTALHEAGVFHRDLKPANLFRTQDGSLKLLDLGLAKRQDQTAITETHSLVGTPLYLAPSILRGEPPAPTSDLASVGLIVSECFLGEPVRKGIDLPALFIEDEADLVARLDSEALERIRPGLSAWIQALIQGRIPTASLAWDSFRGLEEGPFQLPPEVSQGLSRIPSSGVSPRAGTPGSLGSPGRKGSRKSVPLGIAVALGLGLGFLFLQPSEGPPSGPAPEATASEPRPESRRELLASIRQPAERLPGIPWGLDKVRGCLDSRTPLLARRLIQALPEGFSRLQDASNPSGGLSPEDLRLWIEVAYLPALHFYISWSSTEDFLQGLVLNPKPEYGYDSKDLVAYGDRARNLEGEVDQALLRLSGRGDLPEAPWFDLALGPWILLASRERARDLAPRLLRSLEGELSQGRAGKAPGEAGKLLRLLIRKAEGIGLGGGLLFAATLRALKAPEGLSGHAFVDLEALLQAMAYNLTLDPKLRRPEEIDFFFQGVDELWGRPKPKKARKLALAHLRNVFTTSLEGVAVSAGWKTLDRFEETMARGIQERIQSVGSGASKPE